MKRNPTATKGRLATTAAAILIIPEQLLAAQDFTAQMKHEPGKSIATHYVSRNGVRNVSTMQVHSDIIYRLDTGKIIALNHKQKTYGEITAAEVRQLIEKKQNAPSADKQEGMRRLGFGGTATVTRIGVGETIAGHATEKYSAQTPMSQGEIWVAPALAFAPGYYDMASSLVVSEVGGLGLIFKELKEQQTKGFLLKSVATITTNPMMKGMTFTRVATLVEKGPIPASTFEPPADYEKLTRPR